MGIRVNKVLGYGLVYVDFNEENQIVDPRFNKDINNIISKLSRKDHKSYLMYLKQNLSKIDYMLAERSFSDWKVNNFITYSDKEFEEDTNVFMVTHHENWYRYDDIIDYIVESQVHGQKSHVEIIKHSIFPYNGMYICKSTGETLTHIQREMYTTYLTLLDKLVDNNDLQLHIRYGIHIRYGTEIQKELKLKNIKDIFTEIIPIIPKEIVLFCKWLNIFTDDKYILDLKPMCYTYWS